MSEEVGKRRRSIGVTLCQVYLGIVGVAGVVNIFTIPPADVFGRSVQITHFIFIGIGAAAFAAAYALEKMTIWSFYLAIGVCVVRIIATLVYLREYISSSMPIFELYLPIAVIVYMVLLILKRRAAPSSGT